MIIKKNDLCLDHIIATNTYRKKYSLPISQGLSIKVSYNDEYIDIAHIYWNEETCNCYIQTIEDRFQTYIVLYDTFADFIYLVDTAYEIINSINNSLLS